MGLADGGSSGDQSTRPAGVRTTTRSVGTCVPTQSVGTSFLQVLQRFQRFRSSYTSAVHSYSGARCASPVRGPPEAGPGTSPPGRSSPSPVAGRLEWASFSRDALPSPPPPSRGRGGIPTADWYP